MTDVSPLTTLATRIRALRVFAANTRAVELAAIADELEAFAEAVMNPEAPNERLRTLAASSAAPAGAREALEAAEAFLKYAEWNDYSSEHDATDVRMLIETALAALPVPVLAPPIDEMMRGSGMLAAKPSPDPRQLSSDPRPPQAPSGEGESLELKYRRLLWLGHGHKGIYGDDGEMQCGECMPISRLYDYKRAPLADVERAADAAKLAVLVAPAPVETPQEGSSVGVEWVNEGRVPSAWSEWGDGHDYSRTGKHDPSNCRECLKVVIAARSAPPEVTTKESDTGDYPDDALAAQSAAYVDACLSIMGQSMSPTDRDALALRIDRICIAARSAPPEATPEEKNDDDQRSFDVRHVRSPSVEQAWQPIATAPKDGTAFRAYAPQLVDADFNPWGSVEACFDGERLIGAVWDGCHDVWRTDFIEPTHWMPLPEPPE